MASSRVLPMWNGALSIARAFEWRGVTLKFPSLSRSGVRSDDGMIVFAMPRAQVRVNDWGCSCPLWVPAHAGARRELGRPSGLERLQHCRLAAGHGVAEGFLLDGDDAPMAPAEALALRVVKTGEEYWATWDATARVRVAEEPEKNSRLHAWFRATVRPAVIFKR
jgi:hypothetical protein